MTDNSRLCSILAKEAALITAMIAAEEETTPFLLAGSAEELSGLNSRKERLIVQMKNLERQRQEILPRGLTLREYISRERPADARDLEALKDDLLQLQASLRRSQKINRELLQDNLSFVASVLNILSPEREGQLYASGGDVQEKGRDSYSAMILDDQA